MNWILTTEEIHKGNRQKVGGKGFALSRLAGAGFTVPETLPPIR
jgi:phosphoenolpyruvate synthase/pyruvate phosphate dikinase